MSSMTGFGVCLYERIRLSVGSIPWWRDFVLSRSYSDRMCQLSCKKSSIFSRPSPSPARLRFILPLLPIDSPPPPSSMSHSDPTWVFSRTNVFNQTRACSMQLDCSDSCRIARQCKPAARYSGPCLVKNKASTLASQRQASTLAQRHALWV